MIYAFFKIMVSIGVAGINPSKLVADILKKKADDIALSNKLREDVTIQRWRLTAAILFGLGMLFILAFFYSSSLMSFYPWAYYAFWSLLFVTAIVFIILSKKEKKFKK